MEQSNFEEQSEPFNWKQYGATVLIVLIIIILIGASLILGGIIQP